MQKDTQTIGILGGGQLGRMLTEAAHNLGFKVIVLDPTPNSPAGQLADEHIIGSFKDAEKILELSKKSDYLTLEIEGVNEQALLQIEKDGIPVHPSPKVIKLIKDKFEQKVFLQNKNIPTAAFALIQSKEDCIKQGEIFGYPYLLKTRFDAYDGRGNYVVKTESDIEEALHKFRNQALYAEKFVPFINEIAVVCARDTFGSVEFFEVVETVQKNNICHIVRSPADISLQNKATAKHLAQQVLEALQGVGVFGIEMFLTAEEEVIINEIAPRVHNSGHLTIEAYSVSQFEQHIRAITGMPLLKPNPAAPAAVMVNILGDRDGEAEYKGEEQVKQLPGVTVHIYGKMETRKERKMGHITATGDTIELAEENALKARTLISI